MLKTWSFINVSSVYLNVSTLQSQAETSLLIFDEVQRNLWVAFLLQVGNDGLAYQFRVTHHMKNLRVGKKKVINGVAIVN